MNNLISWLLSAGLDSQRAQLYLAALERGEGSAKDLAQDLNIGRTAIYDNLRTLEERGFIKTVFHGKRKSFIALPPKELYKKFEIQKQELKDLLPDFLALYVDKGENPSIRIFQGPLASREVYEDILKKAKKEYVYFSPPELTLQTVDKTYIKKWIARRVNAKLYTRSLRIKSKSVHNEPIFNEQVPYLRQIRYLPEYVDLKASIYIYENNIGLISTRKEGIAYIIYSPDLAFSLKQIFEFLWGIGVRS
ncbi:MAG: hypothetical protein HYS45_02260 [Parcubacteria group bacterium]|nr:hypothetical protein [Parcubacteria group bacterium]